MTTATYRKPTGRANSGLPDPARQPDFYAGVPLSRALAWVMDMVLIAILAALFLPFTAFLGAHGLCIVYIFMIKLISYTLIMHLF